MTHNYKNYNKYSIIINCFLACISILLFWQTITLFTFSNGMEYTEQVISKTNILERQVLNINSNLGWFVLTGEQSFLLLLNQEEDGLLKSMKSIQILVKSDYQQKQRVDQIFPIYNKWKNDIDELVSLKKEKGNRTFFIQALLAKKQIESIRTILKEILSTAEQLRLSQIASTQKIKKVIFILLLVMIIFVVIGIALSIITNRQWKMSQVNWNFKQINLFDQLNLALEAAKMGTWSMDIKTGKTQASPSLAALYGLSEVEGYSSELIAKLIHPDDRADLELLLANVFNTPSSFYHEFRIIHADGQIRWHFTKGAIVLDEHGLPLTIYAVQRDISEQSKTKKELLIYQNKLEKIEHTMNDGIIIVDNNGKMEFINKRFEQMFGYSHEELLHKTTEIIMPDRFKQIHVLNRTLYFKDPFPIEMGKNRNLLGQRKDGIEIHVEVSVSPIQTVSGVMVTVIVRDISEKKDLESDRARQNAKDQNNIDNKNIFLSTLSQNLRTPLAAILGWSQLMHENQLDNETTERGIRILEKNAKNQATLLENIFEISKIQSGALSLALETIEPQKLITDSLLLAKLSATNKLIKIEVNIEPSIKNIFADPLLVQTTLSNIIENSITFSPPDDLIKLELKNITIYFKEYIQIQVFHNCNALRLNTNDQELEIFTNKNGSISKIEVNQPPALILAQLIIEMHSGVYKMENSLDRKKTTFTILLPVEPRL